MENFYYLLVFQLVLFVVWIIYSISTGGTGTWNPFEPPEDDPGDELSQHRVGCVPAIFVLVSIPIAIYFFSWWSIFALLWIWGSLIPLYIRIKTNRSLNPEAKLFLKELLDSYGFSVSKVPVLASKALGPGSISGEPFSMRVWNTKQSLCIQILGIGRRGQLYVPWDDIDLIAEAAVLIEKRRDELERVPLAYLDIEKLGQKELIVPWSKELSEIVRAMPNKQVIKR